MPAASKTALVRADGCSPLLSGRTEDTSCCCQQDHCLLTAGMAPSPGNEAPTRSWGFLAFLLQEMMLPCSEPIMNFVGPACRVKGSDGKVRNFVGELWLLCLFDLRVQTCDCNPATWSASDRHPGMQETSGVRGCPRASTLQQAVLQPGSECRGLSLV